MCEGRRGVPVGTGQTTERYNCVSRRDREKRDRRSEKERDEGEKGTPSRIRQVSILPSPPLSFSPSSSPIPQVSPFPFFPSFSSPSLSSPPPKVRWSQGTGQVKYFRWHREDDPEVRVCELTPLLFLSLVYSPCFSISLSISLSHTHPHPHVCTGTHSVI
jgi:hypothetical protein